MDNIFRPMWEEEGTLERESSARSVDKKYFNKITVTKNEFTDSNSLYYTVEIKDDLFHNDLLKEKVIKELCAILSAYFKKYGIKKHSLVLVAALGNDKVTADSLGGAVADRLTVTSHLFNRKDIFNRFGNLSGLKCGVSGVTGLASFDVLSAVSDRIKPSLIIAVDTLSCGSAARLGRVVQFTDIGLEPGGGVGNPKTKLTSETLGVPVLAIGVPFVMYVKKILAEFISAPLKMEKSLEELVVTAKEIDFLIGDFSHIIAEGINRTVHKNTE